MKITKKTFLAFAIMAAAATLFTGCRKGEGDPLISLQSRKARVAGNWTYKTMVNEYSYNESKTFYLGTVSEKGSGTEKLDGSSYTSSRSIIYTGFSGTMTTYIFTGNGSATANITFGKDGTFKQLTELKDVKIVAMGFASSEYSQKIEKSGTWNFLVGAEADYKNKERIILNTLEEKTSYTSTRANGSMTSSSSTITFDNGANSQIWRLNTLKGKEMVIEGTSTSTGSYTSNSSWGGTSSVSSSTSSETGTVTATLVQ